MAQLRNIYVDPPLINSSCAWASDLDQLKELYNCPWTGAVTVRTATLDGFTEDPSHTVVFAKDSMSSLNSYGYSPFPLSVYTDWIYQILSPTTASQNPKPFIISITSSSPPALSIMIDIIQALRTRLEDREGYERSRVAIELNTSCPNIRGSPPAYSFSTLLPLLQVLAVRYQEDPTLTIGLKLAPYVASSQFEEVVYSIASFSSNGGETNPFAFFTCTNTLGSSLLFANQTTQEEARGFALAPVLGGLAGESIHALSLGNVYTFSQCLSSHKDNAMRAIKIIGVGGVTSPEGVKRMRDVGARIVGCATLLGREGVAGFERLSRIHI